MARTQKNRQTPAVPPLLNALVLHIDPPAQPDVLREAAQTAVQLLKLGDLDDCAATATVREHVERDDANREAIAALTDPVDGDELFVSLCLSASTFGIYLGVSLAFYMLTGKDGVR